MSLVISREGAASILKEGKELMRKHWEEVNVYPNTPVDSDDEKFMALERAGILVCFSIRDNGLLVGYTAFILTTHLHYKTTLYALNDAIFLDPKYRRGLTGYRLIKFCEEELRKLGVNRLTWHIKPTVDWSKLTERLGYRLDDIVMSKDL